MFLKAASDLEKLDIETLIELGLPENRNLEFKEKLPDNNDSAKKEFLADVSSFANSGGGLILYGIGENREANVKIGTPKYVGLKNIAGETERTRLDQIIRLGFQPPIPGIQIKEITGFEHGPVMAISIPQSWNAPHMVSFRDSSRFFSRSNTGKFQMDHTEIRRAYISSEQLEQRIRKFREERIKLILENQGPLGLINPTRIVCHWVPVASYMSGSTLSAAEMEKHSDHSVLTEFVGTNRFNLDGYLKYNADARTKRIYLQIFKSGTIEWKRRFQKGPLPPVCRSHVGHQCRFKVGPLVIKRETASAINNFS